MKICTLEFYQSVPWKTTLLGEWGRQDWAEGEVELWFSRNKTSANPTGSLNVDDSSHRSSNWGKGARIGLGTPHQPVIGCELTPWKETWFGARQLLWLREVPGEGLSSELSTGNTLLAGRTRVSGTPQSPLPWVTPQIHHWELNAGSS